MDGDAIVVGAGSRAWWRRRSWPTRAGEDLIDLAALAAQIATDRSSRVLRASGEPLDGLRAAGEVAGFGGGGVHGDRALEGTFLGECLFSGRIAGRAAAAATAQPGSTDDRSILA